MLEVIQTPLPSKEKALFWFSSVNAVLFRAMSLLGAGFMCGVNIHLGLTPETHKLLTEHVLILHSPFHGYTLTALFQ